MKWRKIKSEVSELSLGGIVCSFRIFVYSRSKVLKFYEKNYEVPLQNVYKTPAAQAAGADPSR